MSCEWLLAHAKPASFPFPDSDSGSYQRGWYSVSGSGNEKGTLGIEGELHMSPPQATALLKGKVLRNREIDSDKGLDFLR